MKIERVFLSEVTLESFADKYDLTLLVVERAQFRSFGIARFYTHFKNTEIMDNGFLVSTTGEGDTPEEAIQDYARKIAGKRIAWKAYQRQRQEIQVPEKLWQP
jgi:hypothetical protein